MSARVLAPLVLVKDQGGCVGYWYAGQEIPWLSDEDRARLEADGLVTANAPAEVQAPAVEPAQAVTVGRPRPPQTAPKAAWVDYASSKGIAKAEAEDLTKQELIALLSD